ncbi:MAG: ketoacyl-ACP synthase III [Bacteroidales bacterium]|nr:ketoacyl-ACP synthase III [Bacteroidales bacterium]
MAYLTFPHVAVTGVAACVPKQIEDIRRLDLIPASEREQHVAQIGITQRRVAPEGLCSSDLCYHSAERLIADLGWNKAEVDALLFVSQTPDYILPATACLLQQRLGLPKECLAFDVALGCSGWVYGLSTLAAYVDSGSVRKALLLVGDCPTRNTSPRSTADWPLFGDAGTCTALEFCPDHGGNLCFHLGTDGAGYADIIIPDGGFRNPVQPSSFDYEDVGNGNYATRLQTRMDGMNVFAFALSTAPKSIKRLCERFAVDIDSVDYFFLHQANKMINDNICKKLALVPGRCPSSMNLFGNTSCASIPLTMVTQSAHDLATRRLKNIASGFGVGLSWATAYFETNSITVPQLIEI